MPFASVSDLPESIRSRFGAEGQKRFLGAFNNAHQGVCAARRDREECAFAIATAAAKKVNKANGTAPVNLVRVGQVVKADDEEQILFVPVLVPNEEDHQEDIVLKVDVELAANLFLKEYSVGEAELGLDHTHTLERAEAIIVQSWTEKIDVIYEKDTIPEGTWMMGIHIPDEAIWKSAKEGHRTGASIEGTGEREKVL